MAQIRCIQCVCGGTRACFCELWWPSHCSDHVQLHVWHARSTSHTLLYIEAKTFAAPERACPPVLQNHLSDSGGLPDVLSQVHGICARVRTSRAGAVKNLGLLMPVAHHKLHDSSMEDWDTPVALLIQESDQRKKAALTLQHIARSTASEAQMPRLQMPRLQEPNLAADSTCDLLLAFRGLKLSSAKEVQSCTASQKSIAAVQPQIVGPSLSSGSQEPGDAAEPGDSSEPDDLLDPGDVVMLTKIVKVSRLACCVAVPDAMLIRPWNLHRNAGSAEIWWQGLATCPQGMCSAQV